MVKITSSHFVRIIRSTFENVSLLLLARYGLYDSTTLKDVPTKMAVSCAMALIVMYSIEGRVTDDSSILLPFTVGCIMFLCLRTTPYVLDRKNTV